MTPDVRSIPCTIKLLACSDEEDVAALVAFACELCDKRFKSEAAFANHERHAASMHNWMLATYEAVAHPTK